MSLQQLFWPRDYLPELHRCTNSSPLSGWCAEQVGSQAPHPAPSLAPQDQFRASGVTLGPLHQDPLLFIMLRVEHSAAFSSWNLEEPETSQKAGLQASCWLGPSCCSRLHGVGSELGGGVAQILSRQLWEAFSGQGRNPGNLKYEILSMIEI